MFSWSRQDPHSEIYGAHHLQEREQMHNLKALLFAECPLPVLLFWLKAVQDYLMAEKKKGLVFHAYQ